jgi:predicted ATPase
LLTKLTIRNFKRFEEVEIELGQNVVFIGPNNSGKTTALQALALWYYGIQTNAEHSQTLLPNNHSGDTRLVTVVMNRLDLSAIPTRTVNSLWYNLQIAQSIAMTVQGITAESIWVSKLNFEYSNEESIYCISDPVPSYEIDNVIISFLPPMSGLVATEDRLERGSIQRRIGEGRTAEVLRNLCYQLYENNAQTGYWDKVIGHIRSLFNIELLTPEYLPSRGEIRMAYREGGMTFDLSASGRGMLQILLLLTYLYANPGSVLLLDEPDAHLEIIRQREIYNLLTQIAGQLGSQIIAASHSEVVLEEAAGLDTAIAFVGRPHRIDKHARSQIAKALKEIPAVDYALAEQTGWVLYLEGPTDRAILQTLAQRLKHPAADDLKSAFCHYLYINKPSRAADHFRGLQEAKPDLQGIALFDRIPKNTLQNAPALVEVCWQQREIENYLCTADTLLAYAERNNGTAAMQASIDEVSQALKTLRKAAPWSADIKASDDFLDPVFELYFSKLGLPNLMRKTNYHQLANDIPVEQISPEVNEKLNLIAQTARRARPRI